MALRPLAELAISLPFKIDALGKVGATAQQTKIWADKVRSVIGTAVGQRVYRPEFGCNAALAVFDSIEYAETVLQKDIAAAFAAHLPLLTLNEVIVAVDPGTLVVTAEVDYTTPNGSEFAVRLGVATIVGPSSISEDFSWQIQ